MPYGERCGCAGSRKTRVNPVILSDYSMISRQRHPETLKMRAAPWSAAAKLSPCTRTKGGSCPSADGYRTPRCLRHHHFQSSRSCPSADGHPESMKMIPLLSKEGSGVVQRHRCHLPPLALPPAEGGNHFHSRSQKSGARIAPPTHGTDSLTCCAQILNNGEVLLSCQPAALRRC